MPPTIIYQGKESPIYSIPNGDYVWEVVSHEFKMSPKNSNEFLALKLREVVSGCLATDNLFFTDKAQWRIDTFLRAAGIAPAIGQPVNFDEAFCNTRINGARFWASTVQRQGEKDPSKIFMEISTYITNKPAPSRAAPATKAAPKPEHTHGHPSQDNNPDW